MDVAWMATTKIVPGATWMESVGRQSHGKNDAGARSAASPLASLSFTYNELGFEQVKNFLKHGQDL